MGGVFSSDLEISVKGVKLPKAVLKATPIVDAKSMRANKAVPQLRGALADASNKVKILQPASITLESDIATLTNKKQKINQVLAAATASQTKYSSDLAALASLSGGAGTNALGTLLNRK